MSGWRMHIGSSVVGSLLVVALSAGRALSADSVRLEGTALAAAETEARVALAPLSDGTPAVDGLQAFNVTEGGAHVRVVPMRYSPSVPGPLANVDHCALAIMEPERPVETVRTIGVGYTETLGCTGLDAIAFPDLDGDGRFEIALVYATLAPPDRYRKTPVVLRRNEGGIFAVDDALGAALDRQGGITTIAALRRAAAARIRARGR